MTNPDDTHAGGLHLADDDCVVDVTRDDGVTRIVMEGDVDLRTVGRLRPFVEDECRSGARKIVIDLSAVEFVDSHGLQLLAETHRRLASEERTLALVPPRDTVWRPFVVTGLDTILNIENGSDGRHDSRDNARTSGDNNGRCGMAETYTNGVWIVKTGEEDAFESAWTEFASWAKTWPGAGTLRLVRDVSESDRYMSFGVWESFDAQRAWKDSPEFRERMARVRQHVEDFTPSVFELVTAVG